MRGSVRRRGPDRVSVTVKVTVKHAEWLVPCSRGVPRPAAVNRLVGQLATRAKPVCSSFGEATDNQAAAEAGTANFMLLETGPCRSSSLLPVDHLLPSDAPSVSELAEDLRPLCLVLASFTSPSAFRCSRWRRRSATVDASLAVAPMSARPWLAPDGFVGHGEGAVRLYDEHVYEDDDADKQRGKRKRRNAPQPHWPDAPHVLGSSRPTRDVRRHVAPQAHRLLIGAIDPDEDGLAVRPRGFPLAIGDRDGSLPLLDHLPVAVGLEDRVVRQIFFEPINQVLGEANVWVSPVVR